MSLTTTFNHLPSSDLKNYLETVVCYKAAFYSYLSEWTVFISNWRGGRSKINVVVKMTPCTSKRFGVANNKSNLAYRIVKLRVAWIQ